LTLCAGAIKFTESDCCISSHDGRASAANYDDLGPTCVTWCRKEPYPGKQFELAVDGNVVHPGRVHPFGDGVVVLVTGVVEFLPLHVDRFAREEVVTSAVIEVQVGVDDDVDTADVEVLLVQGVKAGIHIRDRRMELSHAGIDQHACVGVVDNVHVDRHQLAVGKQLGHTNGSNTDCSSRIQFFTSCPTSWP
jgi:hypothetical protein